MSPVPCASRCLLTGTTEPAVVGAACELVTYSGNAVDQVGFGALIEHYDAAWFLDAANGDFHLTASGAAAIGNAATWAPGDPPLDVDATARPTSVPGTPGIDQP